ncbi:MAG: glycosyltransferase [Solirubrobacteraceae bacterium]
MADPRVDISVLVPVLNEGANLSDVVDAMRAQSFDGSVEFLFLDGGSADATVSELLRLSTLERSQWPSGSSGVGTQTIA